MSSRWSEFTEEELLVIKNAMEYGLFRDSKKLTDSERAYTLKQELHDTLTEKTYRQVPTFPIHQDLIPQVRSGIKTTFREVVEGNQNEIFPPRPENAEPGYITDDGWIEWIEHRYVGHGEFEEHTIRIPSKPKLRVGEIFRFENCDIDLRCIAIRCEFLQKINEKDAIKEGVESDPDQTGRTFLERQENPYGLWRDYNWRCEGYTHKVYKFQHPTTSFSSLWSYLYPEGPKRWEQNPAVFVYHFQKVEK